MGMNLFCHLLPSDNGQHRRTDRCGACTQTTNTVPKSPAGAGEGHGAQIPLKVTLHLRRGPSTRGCNVYFCRQKLEGGSVVRKGDRAWTLKATFAKHLTLD